MANFPYFTSPLTSTS